jgi:hypothetical protein
MEVFQIAAHAKILQHEYNIYNKQQIAFTESGENIFPKSNVDMLCEREFSELNDILAFVVNTRVINRLFKCECYWLMTRCLSTPQK